MVGPRSSGCRTCVRRRIRCDETRPHCRRCQTAGFRCIGFSTPLKFMPAITPRGFIPAEETGSKSPPKISTGLEENDEASSSAEKKIVVVRDGRVTISMPGLILSPVLPSTPPGLTDDTYCIFFLDRYFCFDSWNDDLQNNKTWIWRALQSPSQYPITNAASRALTATFFAQVHNIKSLDQYAYHLHGVALKNLVSRIQDNQISFDVLAANALLILYEVCSHTSQKAWLKHTKATRSLYQKMGPQYFKHRPARSLLMMNRFAIIAASIFTRERCFLAEEKWHNILSSDDREASLSVKLGDMGVHFPEILERITVLERLPDPSQSSSEGQNIFRMLIRHLEDMQDWWHQWSSDPRRLPTRATFDTRDDPVMHAPPNSPFGRPLLFCNLEAAGAWCRYHAHVVMALAWMRRLLDLQIPDMVNTILCERRSGLSSTTRGKFNFQVCEEDIQSHAVAVCEGLHYYSVPRYRHIGATYMSMPARVAWQALPGRSPHKFWIEDLIQFMVMHSGFAAPSSILSLGAIEYGSRAASVYSEQELTFHPHSIADARRAQRAGAPLSRPSTAWSIDPSIQEGDF